MKTPFQSCSKPVRFLGILLSWAASLSVYGTLAMPAVSAAATTPVAVAQQPLTLQPTIPPNIVLMLDDSGSMNWDFMPDAAYLTGHFTATDENSNSATYVALGALRDSAINGVYYNPSITYTVPVQANGTPYPTATLGAAYINPFASTASTVDVTQHYSPWLCDYNNYDNSNSNSDSNACPDSLYYAYPYFTAFPTSGNTKPPVPACSTGDSTDPATGMCSGTNGLYAPTYSCNPSGNQTGNLNLVTGYCEYGTVNYAWLFTYTTPGSTPGSYVSHYVGKSSSDCNRAPSGTCVSDAASQTNVGIWFSYYRKRILMAKSGLMTAFSDLNPGFRIGFASINGNNVGALPTSQFAFNDAFYGPDGTTLYGGNASNAIAQVQPFDSNCFTNPTTCTPGATGTQRKAFWTWLEGESASGGTPLRSALDAVGRYYGTADATTPGTTSSAWDWMSSDPGYSKRGDAGNIACRQSYTILTTDGFWNGDYQSSTTGGASDTSGPTQTGANGQSYTYNAAAPYSGGATSDRSPSLADVAMYYWKNDLQPRLDNEVLPSTDDPAFWQHMVTFTLGLGFTPVNITPAGTTTQQIFNWANGGAAITGFLWPSPSPANGGSVNNIADLEHAGVNGHGGFFSATNPQSFVSGIEAALNHTLERVGTGASLAANSTELTTGTVIYQANYYTSTWKGNLKAFAVNAANGAIATAPTWQAAQQMPAATSRTIQTWNGSAFLPFTTASINPTTGPGLSAAQNTALGGGATGSATTEQDNVNYLRGDRSLEQQNGGTLRSRDWVLGDIVDSQPVYSGPPAANEFVNQSFYGTTADSTGTVPFYNWAVGTTNATTGVFTASAASQRTPLIFVAANDGMLHAFNAQTGAETFAYLPGAVITAGLANLSNPAYGTGADPHQFYNDGQLTIADAYVQLPGDTSTQWHTILVGTTGRGTAKAVYALDVTDPANIKPLWERSAGDSGTSDSCGGATNCTSYIGQMVGKPVIAQTNTTTTSSTWSVLIGNGYNSTAGVSALLQFNLVTGALNVHTTTDTSTGNGLAAPVAWMDNAGDGVSDVAYAGDLHGHVWSFQLNDTTGANPTPTSTGTLLFTAKDASGNAQPITAGMLAGMYFDQSTVKNKTTTTRNVWLFFGTGQYLDTTDLSNTSTQTWYGIIVQSSNATLVSNLLSKGRGALVQRTITAQTTGGGNALPARTVSTQVTNTDGTTDMTGMSGWYMDLLQPPAPGTQQGERMVDPNEFQGSLLIGVTRIPKVTDVCNPSGSGWVMAIDPFTGAAPTSDFFDTNGDGYVNAGDRVNGGIAAGVGFSSLPNAPIFVGGIMETSFDNGTTASLKTAGTVGTSQRVNWRELVNP